MFPWLVEVSSCLMCVWKKEGDATDKKGLINKLTGIYIYNIHSA